MPARPRICVGRELADRQHHADPVQAVLLLRMHADMGGAIDSGGRGASASRRHAVELAAELLLGQRHDLVHAEASMTYFSRALLRLVRSP